jgi:hypothetical protein
MKNIKINKMKKIFAIAFLGTMGLVSCKKDYTCECTETTGTSVYTIKETSKKVAKAVCEGEGYDGIEYNGQAVPQDNNCTLKK